MRLKVNLNGFSLVEVMVASVIFSIAVVGIYASLAAVKQQTKDISDKSLGAALCGQQFLESRRAAVDMRDWTTGLLATTDGFTAGGTCIQNGITYTISYQIANDAAGHSRKATVTVTWP